MDLSGSTARIGATTVAHGVGFFVKLCRQIIKIKKITLLK